ncbi:hypothetical protein WJX74_002003 [Apatococcus lobatus]|uniref:Uncharacterized protein n=1 Tax=Apatococcus lobatus TaxID=904363 RepID=A0AAW1S203_9CHLO
MRARVEDMLTSFQARERGTRLLIEGHAGSNVLLRASARAIRTDLSARNPRDKRSDKLVTSWKCEDII